MPIGHNSRTYRGSLLGGVAIVLLATIAFSGGFQRVKAPQGAEVQFESPAAVPRA